MPERNFAPRSEYERIDFARIVEVAEQHVQPVNRPSDAGRAAARTLHAGNGIALAELHSDGTLYKLVAFWHPEEPGRLMVVLINFRTAWHFSSQSLAPYIEEKLHGVTVWDAHVIERFLASFFTTFDQLEANHAAR
jgi:hypothetical protein